MSKPTTTYTLRLPQELKEAAEAVAIERDENLSQVVRKALQTYIANHQQAQVANLAFQAKTLGLTVPDFVAFSKQTTLEIEPAPETTKRKR